MKKKIALIALAAAVVPQMFALNITEIRANGKNKQKLIDGITIDSSYWNVVGERQNIDFVFSGKENIARIRIYPGIRAYAGYPSTESGPRELVVWGKKNGKFVKLLDDVVKLPRDPQKGNEFFCDIELKGDEVSEIRLEILSSHDVGFRMTSPTKSVAGPEKRALNIREVKFFTSKEVNAEKAKLHAQFADASAFLKKYDAFAASNTDVSKVIKEFWGRRFEELRREIEKGVNPEKIVKDAAYLEKQVAPYMSIKNNYKGDNPVFSVKVTNSVAPGTPVEFPMHFSIFEKLIGKKLSVFNVKVEAVVNGKFRPIRSNLNPLTPNRGKLCWNTVEGASEYLVILNDPVVGETPLMHSAIGNGDNIMINEIGKSGMSWRTWNVRSGDIFNDGKPALFTGMWTDYAHIYRNLGTKEKPSFHEGAHYLARDPYDERIGTTHHHGLAFSLVETADLSGDGKLDVILSRTYNGAPIFVENVSPDSNSLDFNHPVEIISLPTGYRYSYGDMDGDKLADAIAISVDMKSGKILLAFGRGLGIGNTGAPVFEKLKPIELAIPKSKETSRNMVAMFPSIQVEDLNNDGLPDLGISVPPNIYVCFNEGTAKNFKFAKVQQVKHENGKPVQNEFFFPNAGWFDINGDNIKDLFTRTASWTNLSKGSVTTVANNKQYNGWLERQATLDGNYYGLAHFIMDDFDNDGNIEYCQQGTSQRMNFFRLIDGKFNRLKPIALEKYPAQRFGCPDTTEYGGLYSQITIGDFDGDGLKDILLNNEHNWRFGYYSLYLNDGKGGVKSEIQIAPKLTDRHLKLVNSPNGKALTVDPDTILDFLSFECQKLVNEKAGAIEFTFASDTDSNPKLGRTFFSSWFWNDKKINNNQLYEYYRSIKDMKKYLEVMQPIAFLQMPDGKIRFQFGGNFCESAPVALKKGVYHKFEVKWNANGVNVLMDGKVIASSNAKLPAFAERLHMGSMVWMAVQYAREYPDRRKSHPTDFSTPACGYFENFKLFNANGSESLALDFEKNFGSLKHRTAPVYRCAPAVIKNFKDGKPALIAQCDDMYRTEMPGNPKARMYIIPFTPVKGKAPVFGEAIPLSYTNGKPFIANSRNVIALYDWDKDGDIDLVMATEHNDAAKHSDGVELFINDGKWNFTRSDDPAFKKLNILLTAHHDIKLQFVNMTGNKEPDMAIWTDPGFRVYSINYLTQDAPVTAVGEISSRKDDAYYDIDFKASSEKMPDSVGLTSKGYQVNNPAAEGYSGIKEVNGRKVLMLDHSSKVSKWNSYSYYDPKAAWNSLTIEFKIRLTGEGDQSQFNVGGVFKDPARKHKTSFMNVAIGRNSVTLGGKKYDFAMGGDFRTFRVIVDRSKNFFKVYDMDNGGREIGDFPVMTATAQHKPCSISFGDGSSAVEGKVELEYFKAAFDRTYYPKLKK